MNRRTTKLIIMTAVITAMFLSLYSCKKDVPPPPAKKAQIPAAAQTAKAPETAVLQEAEQETPTQTGYVYERRGRRDPFKSLIEPVLKLQQKDETKAGTLEGYDLSEFAVSAIAKRDRAYFALLVTPDNRSFTVKEGTPIGLNKGKIEKITDNEVVMTEYAEDFRGKSKPRQITLELHKGETR